MVYLNYTLSSLSSHLIDTRKAFELSSGVQYLAVENIESHCLITGVRLIRLDAYNRRTLCCMSAVV